MEGKYLYEIGDLVKVRDDIDRNMQFVGLADESECYCESLL